ncbi:polysaccharide biosynthesis/export family protein [Flavobacterium sp.]|uniref:polysaccharide biosynthesis/export family protein n=1 Tax=Flavobacterium sp. TaxID=239 RepID=UPI00261FB739|nr:polysaccharide biosynthesis/export family protein [Flavobacterium sp.]
MRTKIKLILLICIALTQFSCVSKKKYYLLQGTYDMKNASSNYEPIIQKDDRISILVSTFQKELAEPFNLNPNTNNNTANTNNINNGYLVDSEGNIDFPVLGKLSVAGYTVDQLKLMLNDKLKSYLVDPVINIRILNFKVSVLGAVQSPGIKDFQTNRVTLLDALAASGDITPYGRRDNILIIRDYQGVKTFNNVDITNANVVNSPYFYLDQNDVIYIQERKAKVDASALPNLPLIVSVASFLTTVLILLNR